MNVKPAIGFLTKDGEAQFTDKVATILEWMTGNPKYATPSPALAVVQTAFAAYKVATANAAQGGVENTTIRDARRAELVALLRQLANYVSATADGDLETLASSGFPIQKTSRTPIGPLPAPNAPSVAQGPITGSMTSVVPPVYGAFTYNWRLALASAPTVVVQTAQTTAGRNTFNDLTAGQLYNVEANAVGAAGTSDWSDDGSMMVV
jgi:hypothetical protein